MLISPLQMDVCYCVGLKLTDVAKSTKPLYPHQDSAFVHVQFHSHQHTHTHLLVAEMAGGGFPIGLWWQWVEKTGFVHTHPNRRRSCTCIEVHTLYTTGKCILTHTPRCVNMGQQVAAQGEQAAAALHDWKAWWRWNSFLLRLQETYIWYFWAGFSCKST